MKVIDKINKLLNALESDDTSIIEDFKKNFDVFERTGKVLNKFLENDKITNKQGEHDEVEE